MHSSLRLPTKGEVQYFREKRLLIHLHEQLVEQIEVNQGDWQLHFQLANLLAFNNESFYKNREIDKMKAELHYQRSLTLLQQLHEQNYMMFQNNLSMQFPLSPFTLSPTDEEKLPSISPVLLAMTQSEDTPNRSKKKQNNNAKSNSITITINKNENEKKRRKRASIREQQNINHIKNERHKTIQRIKKYEETTAYKPKIKKRKLLILLTNDNNQISKEIRCKYSSAMSIDEIQMERHTKKKKKKVKSKRFRQYMAAIQRLNRPITSRKRPSIIMMYTPDSPHNGGAMHLHMPGQSNMALIQSQSEDVAEVIEYVVPHNIIKGYTECFFGYGKYLVLNDRNKEGVHNLLDCASWYDDSFVDPSCLTSLVLPPQFLFQDSVKKRHCINFRTLSKYISSILTDEQRMLDKEFKELNMPKYIAKYEFYLEAFEDDIEENLAITIQEEDEMSLSPTSPNEGTLKLSLNEATSKLRVSLHTNDVHDEIQSPMLSLINYKVYPQNVQHLVAEYHHLCVSYHRLGILLTDFMRYSDAKRQFNRALMIFKKLKIKPGLYDEIVSEMRNTQTHSQSPSLSKDRAQYLASKHCTPGSRSNVRAPLSPSFEFSFSDHYAITAK